MNIKLTLTNNILIKLPPQLRPGECCVEVEVRAEVAAPLLQLDQDQVAEVLGVLSVKVEWDNRSRLVPQID